MTDDLTARALTMLDLGMSVIPAGIDKRPKNSWRRYQSERPSRSQVIEWAESLSPEAWGVVTGRISGVVVLDFDGDAGRETLAALGLDPHVRTGSGGFHVYVEHPGWPVTTVSGKAKKSLSAAYPGMDVRGDGGYAIFAGRNERGSYDQLRPF